MANKFSGSVQRAVLWLRFHWTGGRAAGKPLFAGYSSSGRLRQDNRIGCAATSGTQLAVVDVEKSALRQCIKPIHIRNGLQFEDGQVRRVLPRKGRITLFADMPDSPSAAVCIAGPATQTGRAGFCRYAWEFTSRLIERKLQDFGVAVKGWQPIRSRDQRVRDLSPLSAMKGSQITNLVRDLARALFGRAASGCVETNSRQGLHGAGVAKCKTAEWCSCLEILSLRC